MLLYWEGKKSFLFQCLKLIAFCRKTARRQVLSVMPNDSFWVLYWLKVQKDQVFKETCVSGPHNTSVLLDDDFCSVTNILCCINILESCDFKFSFCAVVKAVPAGWGCVTCDGTWSQAALSLLPLRMRPSCSQGWEPQCILLPTHSSSFCPSLSSEQKGCRTLHLPHSWCFGIELSISRWTFCTQITPLLGMLCTNAL